MSYKIRRAAVEVERIDRGAVDIELAAIGRQQRRFAWITYVMIGVSFVHMFAALALFSGREWYEQLAAAGMTIMVDLATWALAEYHHYATRRKLARSGWVRVLFGVALFISCTLNGSYLYANRPAEQQLPYIMAVSIAVLFALFVPMLIGVSSLIRGELEDDRIQADQRAAISSEDVQINRTARKALTRTNEHIPLQLDAEQPSVPASDLAYNAKAEIATTDAEAIILHLYSSGVQSFSSARELSRLCGWGSPSSGSAGLKTLIGADAVHRTDDGVYTLVYTEQESEQ